MNMSTTLSTPQVATNMPAKSTNGIALNGVKQASMAQIDAVAKDFEAQFISQMLSSMFATRDAKDSLGGSDTEETYQSMMVNEYGKIIAKAGGLGVADQIKRHMLHLQETEPPHA
jgi:Rod binding domain-containing protein